MKTVLFLSVAIGISAVAWSQTQLDLHNQAKKIDFSNVSDTHPVQVGTVLPVSCTAGALFFKSNAPAGANLFGCTSANVWSILAGDGSGGVSNASQLAAALDCRAASANGIIYTCNSSGVVAYAAPLTLVFTPNMPSAGAVTLNVNNLGLKSILRADGNGVSAGELAAGIPYLLSFDGLAFRMIAEELESDGTGTITVNRGTMPRTIGVTANTFGQLNGSNQWQGNNDFSAGLMTLPQQTIGGLPPAVGNAGKVFVATDAVSASDCSAGGGAAIALCRSNGVSYSVLGGSGSSPEVMLYKTANQSLACNGAAQLIASYSIPAGALAVGDVVMLEAALDRSGGSTDAGMYVQFGGINFPQSGFSGGGGWVRGAWTVVSSNSEIGSGIALKGLGDTLGGDTYSNSSSVSIANSITVGVGVDSACSAGNIYRVQYFTVRRIR